jgi:hypothetical protein
MTLAKEIKMLPENEKDIARCLTLERAHGQIFLPKCLTLDIILPPFLFTSRSGLNETQIYSSLINNTGNNIDFHNTKCI